MSLNHRRPKRDPFFLLIMVVAIGMAITLFYQIQIFYGDDPSPLAVQRPDEGSVGG
jgi:hypothetical protein